MTNAREQRTRADVLLGEGLERFGHDDREGAIACWLKVLELFPGDATARDYLRAAGADPSSTPKVATAAPAAPPGNAQSADVAIVGVAAGLGGARGDIEQLVRSGEYGRALELLYDARRRSPEDESLSRSIRILKGHLRDQYEQRLGDLSRVPMQQGPLAERMGRSHHQVYSLADGIATLEDIVESATQSQYQVYRCLVELLAAGCLVLEEQTHPGAPPIAAPAEDVADFAQLFDDAMRCYLRRNYDDAETLLAQCQQLRPDDRRVKHNLDKLRGKKR